MSREVTVVVSDKGTVDSVWLDPAKAASKCESLDETYNTVVSEIEDDEEEGE